MAGQYRFKDINGNVVAQISSSADGTISFSGSAVDFSNASTITLGEVQMAGTASNALLLDGFDSTAFVFTSSFNTISQSISSQLNTLQTTSDSNVGRLDNLESKSSSVDISISNINSFTASNNITSLNSKTGSYATTGSNSFYGTQVFSGSVYIANDLIVQGSSSIQYISASSVSIGTNIVQLNTATPSVRFAGISVQDSGSSVGVTGSILWDSLCNKWIYSNPSTVGYSGGMLMSGPRSSQLGNETPLTCNYIAKSGGGDHLYDSCIIDDGTTTCIKNNLVGTGTACFGGQVCAPSFTGGTISGTSGTFNGNVTISVNQNSLTRLIISNTTAGTGAYIETSYTSDSGAGAGAVGKFGSITTPYKITTASNTYLYNSVAGDIAILNDFSSGAIKMAAGGSSTPHFIITSAGISCFSNTACTPNLISTDATHTTIRMGCTIVPLANYRTTDCGYGGIDFFDNGKGYACAAKFYTFKSVSGAEYYGLTNDYNGSAQLSLVSCGAGGGNNVSIFTGTSNVAKLRIDNNVSCFSQTVCAPTLVGNASSQQIMAIGSEADIWMCSTGGGAGTWRLLGSTGSTTKLFRIYDGDAGSNRFTIKSDGLVCMPFGVKFGNGSGQLNYYEEGSWTPALQGATVSYDFRSGSYIRMGNYVFVRWGFRISSISGQSGTVTISGLPFTAVNWGSYQEPNVSVSTGNLATADYAQRARLYKGGNDTSLYGRIADNGDTSWNTGQLQNGSWIIGEIYYNV